MDAILSWRLASYLSWQRRAIATLLGPCPSPLLPVPGSDLQAGGGWWTAEPPALSRALIPRVSGSWVWVGTCGAEQGWGCVCLHVCEHVCGRVCRHVCVD